VQQEQAITLFVLGVQTLLPILMLLVFCCERLFPVQKIPLNWRRVFRNIGLYVFTYSLVLLLLSHSGHFSFLKFQLHWRPAWSRGWSGFIFDIFLLDFMCYLLHRFAHEWPFLWRFHYVHHIDQYMDLTTTLRLHMMEIVLLFLVPIMTFLFFDVTLISLLAYNALTLYFEVFQHSNIKLPNTIEKILSLIWVTPTVHWIHHYTVNQKKDSNYGIVFSIYDRLLGTYVSMKRTEEMPIGVNQEREHSFFHLILMPFLPSMKQKLRAHAAQRLNEDLNPTGVNNPV